MFGNREQVSLFILKMDCNPFWRRSIASQLYVKIMLRSLVEWAAAGKKASRGLTIADNGRISCASMIADNHSLYFHRLFSIIQMTVIFLFYLHHFHTYCCLIHFLFFFFVIFFRLQFHRILIISQYLVRIKGLSGNEISILKQEDDCLTWFAMQDFRQKCREHWLAWSNFFACCSDLKIHNLTSAQCENCLQRSYNFNWPKTFPNSTGNIKKYIYIILIEEIDKQKLKLFHFEAYKVAVNIYLDLTLLQ